MIPATATRVLTYWLRKTEFQNLFLYTLGAGFIGAALSVLAIAAAVLLILLVSQQPSLLQDALANGFLLLPMMFSEAFVNGMIVTSLTVFFPDVMKTFDQDFYLGED